MIGGIIVTTLAMDLGWLADRRAAVAAALLGGVTFGFAGIAGALLLVAFFVSSSVLSRLPSARSSVEQPVEQAPSKQPSAKKRRPKPRRTARQVVANGAVLGISAIALGLAEHLGWGDGAVARMALLGALAAATADTWATEIGTWWGAVPRSAVTARTLEPGESGGVTSAGTLGAMMGAGWIAFVAYWIWPDLGTREVVFIEAAGLFGMWIDSVLGATVQYKATCPQCSRIVEDIRHPHTVRKPRGLRFVDNDVVNVLGTAAGALVAVYLILTV